MSKTTIIVAVSLILTVLSYTFSYIIFGRDAYTLDGEIDYRESYWYIEGTADDHFKVRIPLVWRPAIWVDCVITGRAPITDLEIAPTLDIPGPLESIDRAAQE